MSTRNRVRRNVKKFIVSLMEFVALVETGGIAFDDGYSIELIRDADGALSFFWIQSAPNPNSALITVAKSLFHLISHLRCWKR